MDTLQIMNVICTNFILIAWFSIFLAICGYNSDFPAIAKMFLYDCYEPQVQLYRPHKLQLWSPVR